MCGGGEGGVGWGAGGVVLGEAKVSCGFCHRGPN